MSAKRRLEFTRKAFRDIAGIEELIAADNPKAAQNVAEALLKIAEQLEENPLLGRLGREEGTRELVSPKYPYIIIYRLPPGKGSRAGYPAFPAVELARNPLRHCHAVHLRMH